MGGEGVNIRGAVHARQSQDSAMTNKRGTVEELANCADVPARSPLFVTCPVRITGVFVVLA